MNTERSESARWATSDELQGRGWFDPSGWPLGQSDYGPVYMPPLIQRAGTLTIAPPRAGKSRGILVPAIHSEARQASERRRSLVIVDPAGELYRLTARTLAKTHRVLVWNPAAPRLSNTFFDPLGYVGSPHEDAFTSQCEAAAAIWYTAMAGDQKGRMRGDSYWDEQAITALAGVLMARASEVPGLTMADYADFLLPLSWQMMQEYMEQSNHKAARLRAAVVSDLVKNEKAASGVIGQLRKRLLLVTNPTVAKTIGRPSVDVAGLVTRPTVLYLQVGTGEKGLQPLLSVALSTVVGQLQRRATAGRPLGREIRFVIDELANIGELYDLDGAINTLGKYGIGFLLAIQTRASLHALYGRDTGDKIIGACNTHLALGGLAPEDAQWVSSQLGVMEWEHEDAEKSWHIFPVRLPSYNVLGGGSFHLPMIPIPYQRTHKRKELRRAALKPSDALRAMSNAMIVLPSQMRAFQCSLDIYTGD